MAKWQVESNDKKQELKVAQVARKIILRGICATEGIPYFEDQEEANRVQQHNNSNEAAARKKKVRRLYDQYRADDENLQVKAIKLRIAQEVGVSIKSVERYLRESKK